MPKLLEFPLKSALKILLVGNLEDEALRLGDLLRKNGPQADMRRVDSAEEFAAAIASGKWDVVLADYATAGFSVAAVLAALHIAERHLPLIAIARPAEEPGAVLLMREGLRDYVLRDNLIRLPAVIEREVKAFEGRRDHRGLEQQLRQAQKMEAIGRLASGVAHDFNNLLTIISGFAQLALMEPNNPAQSGLEQILKAADRAAGLTRQLLVFSRQQASNPRVFDLNHLIRDLEKMIQRVIGEDIDFITNLSDVPAKVRADPGQIEQVILNLAVNARDAMLNGGRLTIETATLRVDEHSAAFFACSAGDHCVMAISDDGSGMTPETLGQAFEPFFTTKAEGQGTGLGLATVYGIVKQSGGAIRAYSESGFGTTMKIYLPRVLDGDTAIMPGEELEQVPEGSETVLLVEDDTNVLNLVNAILVSRGYNVFQASESGHALYLAQSHPGPIDLLLSDVIMPGSNGPALARQITAARPGIRKLFMSGYSAEAINRQRQGQETVEFIQKPFLPSDLARKVRKVLDTPIEAEPRPVPG